MAGKRGVWVVACRVEEVIWKYLKVFGGSRWGERSVLGIRELKGNVEGTGV